MNTPAAEDRELLDLLAQHFEGQLTEASKARLQDRLRQDAAARQLFRRYALIVAGVHWELADSQHAEPIVADTITPRLTPSPTPSLTPPVVAPSHRPTAPSSRSTIFGRPTVWSIALVGLLFCAYAGVLLWNLRSGRLPNGTDDNELAVATIRNQTDAQWSPNSRLNDSSTSRSVPITANQPLSITAGLLELQLTGGTTLLIEGPADWQINGNNAATLTRGKLVAKVPKQAIGFSLETPTAKIIDLGTEFGVAVDNSGGTEVHVLRGTVESTTRKSNSSAPPKPIRLATGEALRIDSSKTARRIAVEGSKFKLSTSSIAAPTRIRTYSEAILADRPLAYWPLDEAPGASSISDRSGNDHTGVVKGALEFGVAGRVSNPASTAARFDGASWIEIAKPEPLALTEDFTVEAWLRPESTNDIGRVVSVDPGNTDHGWGFGWLPRERFGNAQDGILFTLYGVKDYRLDRQPWPSDQGWHHLAIICDRNRHAHLFVDGKWSAMVEGQKRGIAGEVQATLGRQSNGTQSYRGAMAHLAIYPRALDERQILRHVELAAAPAKLESRTDTNQNLELKAQ